MTTHKTYVVGVRAGNDSGWSAWTNSAPIAPQLPAAPASVTLTRSAGQLTVTWAAVSEATSYNINLSGDGTNSWTRAESGVTGTGNTITKTIDSGIENWRWYIAAVQSVNAKGAGGWANSDFVGPIYPPGQVRNLNAERVGTGISVTWDAPANDGGSAVTGYDVNYTLDGVHSWTRVSSNQSATSATISDVSNAVGYVVAVRANNGVGEGAWTNSAPVAGLAGPSTVTAVKGGDYIEGEWTTVAGATGYDVNLLYFQNEYHYRIETNMSGTSRRIYINDGGAFSPEQFVIAVRARNTHGPGAWVNSPPATAAPELDASSVTTTTATLTISNLQRQLALPGEHGTGQHLQGPGQRVHKRPDRPDRRHGIHLHGIRQERLRQRGCDCVRDLHHHRGHPHRGAAPDHCHPHHGRPHGTVVVPGQHRPAYHLPGSHRRRNLLR